MIFVGVWQFLLALTGAAVAVVQFRAARRNPALLRGHLPEWRPGFTQALMFSGIAVFCLLAPGLICSSLANAFFPGLLAEKKDVLYLIPATQTLSLATILIALKAFPGAFPKTLDAAAKEDREPAESWLSPANAFGVPAFFSLGFSGALAATILVSGIVLLLPESMQAVFRENQILVDAFGQSDPLIAALCVPAVAIFTPIIEEIIFRAGLYRLLKSKIGAIPAALLSSIIFALMHDAPMSYLPLTLLGCVFCLTYEKTGRIVAPICVHALFNANTLLCLAAV